MELHKVDEIGENSRMMMVNVVVVFTRYAQIVVIQNQSFHVRYMMVALASYLTNVVV